MQKPRASHRFTPVCLCLFLALACAPFAFVSAHAAELQAASGFDRQGALEVGAQTSAIDAKMLGSLTLNKGRTRTMQIDNVNDDNIVWFSTKTKVASVKTVKNKAVVTGKKVGTATIVANCKTIGRKYAVTLTVKDPKAIALSKPSATLRVGKTLKLTLKKAKKASKIKWSSKNKKVATVTKKGVVKAKKAGKAKIVAKYGKKSYVCAITVKNKVSKMKTLKNGTKTVTASKSKAVKVGTLKKEGYQVILPAGALANGKKVKVTVKDNKIDLSAVGESCVRLKKAATVKIALNNAVEADEIDRWRGVYCFGGETHLIEPDVKQLRKGVLQYEVSWLTQSKGSGVATQADAGALLESQAQDDAVARVEGLGVLKSPALQTQAGGLLSWFTGKKVTDADRKASVAYKAAVEDISRDCRNDMAQKFVEKCFGDAVEKLGIPEDDPARTKIMKQLGKSADLFALVQAARSGDESAFTGKATEMLAKVVIDNADGTKVGYLGAAVGSVPGVLSDIRDGKYKKATERVAKAVVGNIPLVKKVQFAAAITETTIDYYVDSETEAAYKAYYGQLKNGAYGYTSAQDVAWSLISKQMAAPLRQMEINAIKAYAEAHDLNPNSMSEDEKDKVRAIVKNSLIKQWNYRAENESKIEAQQKEISDFLTRLEDEGLMNRGDTDIGFNMYDDYTLRLELLLNVRKSINSMLGGKTYAEWRGIGEITLGSKAAVAQYNEDMMVKLVKLWVQEGFGKGKNQLQGRTAVAKFLAEEVGLGVKLRPGTKRTITLSYDKAKKAYNTVKETFSLTGTFKAPSWITTNNKVATVSKKGVVTALKPGKAIIQARYGEKVYECELTVKKGADEAIKISPVSATVYSSDVTHRVTLYKIVNGDFNNPVDIAVPRSAWSFKGDLDCVSYWLKQLGEDDYVVEYTGKAKSDSAGGTLYVICTYQGNEYQAEIKAG